MMKNHTKNSQKGQSLVEFALSLTVIMMLLAGAVEFGIALFQYVQLRDAAQEGALYGSLNPTDTAGIEARVRAASNSPIDLQNLADVCVWIPTDGDPCVSGQGLQTADNPCEGSGIQVVVSFEHNVFMPFMSAIIGPTIPINATVTDTILLPACSP